VRDPNILWAKGCALSFLDLTTPPTYKRGVLREIFTWWTGATLGARWQISRGSHLVGEDEFGNRYFETSGQRYQSQGRDRRFVIYKGYADASKVPPDWHGWLHHTFEQPPTVEPLKRRPWEIDYQPNLTGTIWAWRAPGSLARGGERPTVTADYEPWKPDEEA
jgi:NADH:ubiquinone oxidoreductase subunit